MIPLAVALGVGVGISLGLLGGGGSILAVPALVYLLGRSVHEAVPASLLVVGSASATGAISYLRTGTVPWRTATLFGIVGMGGSFAGAYLNHRLADDALLLGFALLMTAAAVTMLRQAPAMQACHSEETCDEMWRRRWGLVAGAGIGAGFLTGLFGVGGGFIIVPALVLLLKLPMRAAIGASLVIIVINSAARLLAHLSIIGEAGNPVSAAFAAGGIVGAAGGERLAQRTAGERLMRGFAYLVLAVAMFVFAQVMLVGQVVS